MRRCCRSVWPTRGGSCPARRPHLVIGVGGYSSGPVVLVAAVRGVPTMLLEQNAVPGLTNRLLAPFVRAAAVTFESTRPFFGSKAFVSGNPVRPEFLESGRNPKPESERDERRASSTRVLSLWRLSGRARDQRGHGGGSGGAGGRRSASSSHAPDGRTRCGDGPRRLPTGGAGGRRRTVPLRHGTAARTGGRDRLPRRRDDAGRDHGGRKGGDSHPAADGDRRSPAQERRGARCGRRSGAAAPVGPDGSRAGAADSDAGAPITRRRIAHGGRRAGDGAAGRGADDRRSGAGAGGAGEGPPRTADTGP